MFRISRRSAFGLVGSAAFIPGTLAAQTISPACTSSAGYEANPEDWANLGRYAQENRQVIEGGLTPEVVFLGDSITQGWPDKRPAFFSAGRICRGIGGQTTPQMLVRMMADVVALRPRKVHIMGGTNDIAGNTGPISPSHTRDCLQAMIAIARRHHIDVLLGSIPPAASFPWRPGLDTVSEIRTRNDLLANLAGVRGVRFIDYTAALSDKTATPYPGMTYDGVHPSVAGYRAMEAVLEPYI